MLVVHMGLVQEKRELDHVQHAQEAPKRLHFAMHQVHVYSMYNTCIGMHHPMKHAHRKEYNDVGKK
jgi:hypothetical protein